MMVLRAFKAMGMGILGFIGTGLRFITLVFAVIGVILGVICVLTGITAFAMGISDAKAMGLDILLGAVIATVPLSIHGLCDRLP